MDEKKLTGLFGQCENLKNQAEELLTRARELDEQLTQMYMKHYGVQQSFIKFNIEKQIIKIGDEARILIGSFNNDVPLIAGNAGISVSAISTNVAEKPESALRQLIIGCSKVVKALKETPLSLDQINTLTSLKQEIAKVCENLDVNFEKNLENAVMEAEKGHFLASALITSRIVDYVFHQIKGEDIKQQIKVLTESGAIEKDDDKTKEQIIKANKKSRNYLNHRIDTFAESSDALSLLGDSLTLLKIYAKIQDK